MPKLKNKPVKRLTNVELVTEIMEYSERGALIQAFVIEALCNYSERVKAAGPSKFDNMLMSGEAWVGCAEEVLTKINTRQ